MALLPDKPKLKYLIKVEMRKPFYDKFTRKPSEDWALDTLADCIHQNIGDTRQLFRVTIKKIQR